jgi:hypothetical protein
MQQLLQLFIDIAMFRRGPQDLPASRSLVSLMFAIYALSGCAQVLLMGWDLRSTLLLVLIDTVMLCGWVWAVLVFFSRRQRFIQTMTAVLGIGTLLAILDLFVRTTQLLIAPGASVPLGWLLAKLIIMSLVLGRIFMLAIDAGLLTGIALTLAIVFSTDAVAQWAVPGV